jgi:hypothetical protein
MADWRKPADYKFPRDLPDYLWAWEFLRRNREYRKDWLAVLRRFQDQTDEFAPIPPDYLETIFREGGTLRMVGEQFTDDPGAESFYLPADEAKKWCLSNMVNPETDAPKFLTLQPDFGLVQMAREGVALISRGPFYPTVTINLHLPLKPQLASAKKKLEELQGRIGVRPLTPKQRRGLWSHYLRLLDADLDDRTPKQIADVLGGERPEGVGEGKIWDQMKAAKRMTEPDGYLSIFLS